MFGKVGWFAWGVMILGWCTACKSNPYDKPPGSDLAPSTHGTGLSTGTSEPEPRQQKPAQPRAIPVARSTGQSGLDDTDLLLQRPVQVRSLPTISFDKKQKKEKKGQSKKDDLSFGVGGLQMDPSMKGLMGQPSGSLLGGDSLTLSTGSSGSLGLMGGDGDDDDDKPSPKLPTSQPSGQPATKPSAAASQPTLMRSRPIAAASQPTQAKATSRPAATSQPARPPAGRLVRVSPPPSRMGLANLTMPTVQDDNQKQTIPAVLARVNDEPADRWSFEQLMKEVHRLWIWKQGLPPGEAELQVLRKQALKRLIDHLLLYQKALQEGTQLTSADEREGLQLFLSRFPKRTTLQEYLEQENMKRSVFLERLRRQLVVRKYMMKLTQAMPFTRRQVMDYYNKHFNSATVRAKQIIIPIVDSDVEAAKAKALHVLKLAQEPGANFVALVRKYSQDSTLNGDIGELKKGDLLPALEQVLFQLRKGQVGGPVQTDMGFHILKVVHYKAPQPLARVQLKIIKQIQMKKLEEVLKKQLVDLRSEGQIEILVPWGKD